MLCVHGGRIRETESARRKHLEDQCEGVKIRAFIESSVPKTDSPIRVLSTKKIYTTRNVYLSKPCYVGPCDNGFARHGLRMEKTGIQIWRVAVNILNKQ
jgi:hypothetical protein